MPDAPSMSEEAAPATTVSAPTAPAPTMWTNFSLRFQSFFFRYPIHPLPHLLAAMMERHDYAIADASISDEAAPAPTVPASTAPAPTVPAPTAPAATVPGLTVLGPTVPAAAVPTAAMPVAAFSYGAVPAVAVSAVGPRYEASIDLCPPPPREKIITQYALMKDKKSLPIITVAPDMRKEHNLNDFRYLKGSVIRSFMNHRVKEMVAKEADQLEKRVSNHILMLRGQGLDRMEAADAGIEKFQTSLQKLEERFVNDEVIALRDDNWELTRENRKREGDFQKMTMYNEEVVEKYKKMQYRALLGMSQSPELRIGVFTLTHLIAERQLFDIQASAARKQVRAEFKRAAKEGYVEWYETLPGGPRGPRATRSASQKRKREEEDQ